MNSIPVIAITSGEPSGIGVEVTLKALQQPFNAKIVVLGDADWLEQVNQLGQLNCQITTIDSIDECASHQAGIVQVLHTPTALPPKLGELSQQNAHYVCQLLQQAHQMAIDGQINAIVTAPVHKGIINDAGVAFTGHTEFFAEQSGSQQVVMMLTCAKMSVALATTHLPLSQVAQAITAPLLEKIIRVCVSGLHRLGITTPRIKVLGLNPHAGEQGHLGEEELTTITPVINACQNLRADITGPYPADTAFSQSNLDTSDLFLAMYHDQGLPVIKFAGFGESANVTLGLPYIRTSVDHGTALDIAEQFNASSNSMEFALNYAIKSANQR